MEKPRSSMCGRVFNYGVMVAAMILPVSAAWAQTLADPHPKAKWSPPHTTEAPHALVKSCRAFGPGFMNVPGTDACVKIGGFVGMEAGGR